MKTDHLALLRSGAPLSTRQQISLTLQLSWPAIMAQLATIIMQYIDAAMVGRLGASQSAAVGLVASTTWLFGGLSYAAAMGFNVLTAQRVGGGRLAEARNILKQALVLCLAFSVVMAALAAALSAPLPRLLRAEQDIWRDASAYFLVYSLFLPALQLDNVAAGQLQATGNMRTPGVCMVLMCALDVVFNTLLIFPTGTIRLGALSLPGAGLGTAGAALGTGLAELAVGLYLLYFVLRRSPALRLEKGERLHLDRTQLRMVLRIAAPVASEKVILSTAQIVSTAIVAPLGTVAIAANSFAVTAESLCYMPAYGIQSAAAMLVGQSVGAGRRRMARRLGWVTVLLGIVVMVITGGLLYAFAPQMMAILTPDSDIIALGTRVLRIEAFAEDVRDFLIDHQRMEIMHIVVIRIVFIDYLNTAALYTRWAVFVFFVNDRLAKIFLQNVLHTAIISESLACRKILRVFPRIFKHGFDNLIVRSRMVIRELFSYQVHIVNH